MKRCLQLKSIPLMLELKNYTVELLVNTKSARNPRLMVHLWLWAVIGSILATRRLTLRVHWRAQISIQKLASTKTCSHLSLVVDTLIKSQFSLTLKLQRQDLDLWQIGIHKRAWQSPTTASIIRMRSGSVKSNFHRKYFPKVTLTSTCLSIVGRFPNLKTPPWILGLRQRTLTNKVKSLMRIFVRGKVDKNRSTRSITNCKWQNKICSAIINRLPRWKHHLLKTTTSSWQMRLSTCLDAKLKLSNRLC